MSQAVTATYRDGAFILHEPCDLAQDAEVQLIVQGPITIPPTIIDPAERARILSAVTERMRRNPLPVNSPRWTREQLHERR